MTKTQDPIAEALEEWSSAKEQHASTRTDEDYDSAENRLLEAEAGLFTVLDSLRTGEVVVVDGERLNAVLRILAVECPEQDCFDCPENKTCTYLERYEYPDYVSGVKAYLQRADN